MEKYGERLLEAMKVRGDELGQKVSRLDVARVAECSRQNIGMILTNSKGVDQQLSVTSREAVAAYLKVNTRWLATGQGPMKGVDVARPPVLPFSQAALQLAELFDMLPHSDRLRRAKAYSAASRAILDVLEAE